MMRAMVYTGPEALEVRDVPEPGESEGNTHVRISRVGICGSDMHAYLGHDERRPAPLILGHEAAGVTPDGRRVTINPLVPCGTCGFCTTGRENICQTRQLISMPPREGAFAQAVVLPDENLVEIPDSMSFAVAALAEPMAVCWHAARIGLRVHDGPLERIVVVGGGAIGLGCALALRAQCDGKVQIIEPNAGRRAYLSERTDVEVVEAATANSLDMVVDAVGYGGTRAVASELVRAGGTIVHVGLGDAKEGFDVRRATLQEITFIGSYCYTKEDFRQTVQAMADGRLGALDWTEERTLDQGPEAFKDLRAGRVAAPKIILNPE